MSATLAPAPPGLKFGTVRNFIGGRFVDANAETIDVHAPATGAVIARTPLSTATEVDAAVIEARKALPGWSATTIKDRVQVLFRYRTLLEQHIDELTALIV